MSGLEGQKICGFLQSSQGKVMFDQTLIEIKVTSNVYIWTEEHPWCRKQAKAQKQKLQSDWNMYGQSGRR